MVTGAVVYAGHCLCTLLRSKQTDILVAERSAQMRAMSRRDLVSSRSLNVEKKELCKRNVWE